MALRNKFISDLAQVANGAASALGGVREEIDNMIRQRMERSLNARGLFTREEFDALRTRHEALAARVAILEASGSSGGSSAESSGESPAESSGESPAESKPKKAPKGTRTAAKKAAPKK